METISSFTNEDDPIELPAGFRFHPTDEELISHYLYNKVLMGKSFSCLAMAEVDLNKSEPGELPRMAKMGEKEWYFFCRRERKYPTGSRTNRATESGYWKATGKDKEIYRGKSLVGMKKTLVFYRGRAPGGEKSNWLMHEFRLDGRLSSSNLPKTAQNEWVMSRIFQKNGGGRKIQISDLVRVCSNGDELNSSGLPHVSCFSNSMNSERNQSELLGCRENQTDMNPIYYAQASSTPANLQFPSSALMADNSIPRKIFKSEREIISVSQETGLTCEMNNEISSVVSDLEMGRIRFDEQEPNLEYFWNY